MPARTGAQYLAGLRQRKTEVWLRGERVTDVTTHPGLAGGARAIASLYDLQSDPAHRDAVTFICPDRGDTPGLSVIIPRPRQALAPPGTPVNPTGAARLWADFNEAILSAMMKFEMFSWPVTLAILVLAFGALVAAGLPLILTLSGLVASAGSLVVINHFVPVSIWAMNFAMMFALALGIDYALFIVVRYRAARARAVRPPQLAIAETMDTAGQAVLPSGATVLIALSAVMRVLSPASLPYAFPT